MAKKNTALWVGGSVVVLGGIGFLIYRSMNPSAPSNGAASTAAASTTAALTNPASAVAASTLPPAPVGLSSDAQTAVNLAKLGHMKEGAFWAAKVRNSGTATQADLAALTAAGY